MAFLPVAWVMLLVTVIGKGHIFPWVHEVPAQGFIDHGYICYTPRFFFDLAGHNEYEVVDFTYLGPSPGKPIMNVVSTTFRKPCCSRT